ncbi:serine carboxypeptidase-like 17 isoform X2 [Magnolia sinica]|uniref:serine carboxypeptidase-like 17 isoform X2 n=1 Tax=Magnolia sinica TaxID=86752 RepID=UPI002658C5DB|nr:serine carboxypeptidase-like 17 isoform X2 [Magnolia sinica]
MASMYLWCSCIFSHMFYLLCLSSLLLFFSCECSEAPHSSTRVRFLPGFQGELPFKLHTGYITIDERNENRLFYYLVESQRNPREDPLMLWLPGGPGFSGLAAMTYHIGPIRFKDAKFQESDEEYVPELVINPYSWTKICSIIFLDFPTGTGFSYSRASEDYQTSETKIFNDVHKFLIQWFMEYPEFLSNPLYLGGVSHSGLTVPAVTYGLASDMEAGKEPRLNLKGYMVGNPYTNQDFDNQRIPFAHGMGLISDELYQAAKDSCGGMYEKPRSRVCAQNIQAALQCVSGINKHHILEPNCENLGAAEVLFKGRARYLQEYKHYTHYPPYCRDTVGEWQMNSKKFNLTHDVFDSIGYHLSLTTKGYRALIYSGDHDFVATFLGTEAWIRYLNFSIVHEWHSWMVDGQVGGFTRQYANDLTYATVKGAGHSAPEYKPKECFVMFYRWISSLPL